MKTPITRFTKNNNIGAVYADMRPIHWPEHIEPDGDGITSISDWPTL